MKFNPRLLLSFLALLVLFSCGTTEELKDTVMSWFKDDPTRRGQTRRISQDEFMDKLRGAWAGKMIGVSYGAPYEFRYQGKIMEERDIRPWIPDYVSNSLQQDDLYVQLTFLEALEEKGLTISQHEIGQYFARTKYNLWHANDAARKNLRAGIEPPDSGHPRYNPHANDIDFQIEADLFGILCPAMPRTAMQMADMVGHVMNYGDGVYGGIFVAGMYSVAYFEDDPETVVQLGLACIPPRSEYARLISDVLQFYKENSEDWQACWKMLEEKWAHKDFCPKGHEKPYNIDAKLNGGYVAIGLLYGKGDFEQTLEITTRCGQDNDCNPSTAAGILGTMIGYSVIPREYTIGIPLIAGEEFSFTRYSYDSLIKDCARLSRDMIERHGGTIELLGDREYFEIVIQTPKPPDTFEQFTENMFRDYQNEWENLDTLRAEGFQRRLQQTLNTFAKGWTISQCGMDIHPELIDNYQGRYGILATYPLDQETPCQLTWRGTMPSQNPFLHLLVTSSDSAPNADWLLRVKANDQQLAEKVIGPVDGRIGWHDLKVDLSQFAGQETTLVLEHIADDWEFETAYWAEITIE